MNPKGIFWRLLIAFFALWVSPQLSEAAKIRVVTTNTDLKAFTEAIGGDLVEVESLARGDQNPHDIELRPSFMLRLRRADLLIVNGAGLDEAVAERLSVGAHNARLLPGTDGYVDASRGVALGWAPAGKLDRSMGDVHPEGNPHYAWDPLNAPVVTANILEGLKRVDPRHTALFEARRKEFLDRLQEAVERWQKTLAPFKRTQLVLYHADRQYFLRRFGLELAGTVEDRPGIPPSPVHLANLIRSMKEQKVRLVIADPFSDQKVAELVAREGGAKLLVLPAAVGGATGVASYFDLFDYHVRAIVQALQ